MNTTKKYSAFLSAFILIMPYAAYADQGSNSQYDSQLLQIQMAAVTCYNAYTTGFLNDVVSVIDNATITSTISNTDMPKLGSDFGVLQTDANTNNTDQFKNDTKIYRTDTKTATLDAHAAMRMVHSKTINSTLKSDQHQLGATYRDCLFGAKQQHVNLKEHMFDKSLLHAENMTKRLESHGVNTTALSHTINTAVSQIQAFEGAVQNVQNNTQLKTTLKSFCLYDGCKDSDNFHFAAKITLDTNQAKLNLLATKNTTSSYQAMVSQAQTDSDNAQTALNLVGSNKYQGTQSSDIWNDLKAASDLIHHLQYIANHKH